MSDSYLHKEIGKHNRSKTLTHGKRTLSYCKYIDRYNFDKAEDMVRRKELLEKIINRETKQELKLIA